ncbi:hypothetical protein HPP92_008267 [Vanilla planifolia]|uniref:Uncharacterized protein n=1 Tax=Vanilla planifolia TaxID=51239 RepID=A0A835V5I3_VANPL|nr:hypothetical protein HPP92_008267 [Vanilla planifolia]
MTSRRGRGTRETRVARQLQKQQRNGHKNRHPPEQSRTSKTKAFTSLALLQRQPQRSKTGRCHGGTPYRKSPRKQRTATAIRPQKHHGFVKLR